MTTSINLGPQAAIYTPPPSCFTPVVELTDDSELSYFLEANYGYECSTAPGVAGDFVRTEVAESCYPPGLVSHIVSNDGYRTVPVYAPGTACPGGWTAACSITQSGQATDRTLAAHERNILSILRSGEVATGCCPSGYTCGDILGLDCATYATSGDVITGATFTDSCETGQTQLTVSSSVTTGIGTAYRVILVNTATEAVGDSDDSGGLSSDAKIAVGVSVSVGVILIVGAALFFFWRGRRAKAGSSDKSNIPPPRPPAEADPTGHAYGMGKPELEDNQVNTPPAVSQPGRAELDDSGRLYSELDTSAVATHELDANPRP